MLNHSVENMKPISPTPRDMPTSPASSGLLDTGILAPPSHKKVVGIDAVITVVIALKKIYIGILYVLMFGFDIVEPPADIPKLLATMAHPVQYVSPSGMLLKQV